MRAVYVWLVLLPPIVWAVYQLATPEPLISPTVAGLLLLALGGIAGLRLGAASASRFLRDVKALNKYLGEQNCDLVELNCSLLKQLSLKKGEPRASKKRKPVEERQQSTDAR